MPYSAELRDEFVARGVQYFLSKYKVRSQAGGGNRTATAVQGGPHQYLYQQLGGFGGPLPGPPAHGAPAQAQALLAAPATHAYFEKTAVAPPPPSGARRTSVLLRDTVSVYFDTASPVGGVAGLPVYLIPSAADQAIGAQLPVHAPGNPNYVFTTTQDGCTVEISGPPNQPFVSHSNAYTAGAGAAAALPGKIAAFQAALVAGGADPLVVGQNRAQFALYPDAALGGVAAGGQNEAQSDQARRLLQGAHANIQTYRKHKRIGHSRTYWTVHQDIINILNGGGQWKPSTSLIAGNWEAPGWAFYYQECGRLKMQETKHRKLGRIVLRVRHREHDGQTVFVVGRFWPGPRTETPFPIVDI